MIGHMEIDTDRIDDTVLGLLWLTLHDERRAWKGHDWDALNRLHEQGLIHNPVTVVLTVKGLKRVLSQILSRDVMAPVVGHSYPASAVNCWNAVWPVVSNCHLRIMCATSMPSGVAEAELKDSNPFICRVSFFITLWSCSMMLFKYLTWRISISQNHSFKISKQFMFCSPA